MWGTGNDGAGPLTRALPREEVQLLGHPLMPSLRSSLADCWPEPMIRSLRSLTPERHRLLLVAVDALSNIAGDTAPLGLFVVGLHPHHRVQQCGQLTPPRPDALHDQQV